MESTPLVVKIWIVIFSLSICMMFINAGIVMAFNLGMDSIPMRLTAIGLGGLIFCFVVLVLAGATTAVFGE